MSKPRKPITDWNQFRDQFAREALRRVSMRWPAISLAKKAARTERKINPATGRLCWHARCAHCKQEFLEKELEVDHVSPIIPVAQQHVSSMWGIPATTTSKIGMGPYVLRLLPESPGLQLLCPGCHERKTHAEVTERATNRRAAKGNL